MATVTLIEYADASPEVRAIYDDIRAVRQTDYINNVWKALAHQPDNLRRVWRQVKDVMQPGVLDPLTKELVYLAVSITNGCSYCIHTHTAAARAKGMTDAQHQELLAVVGLAHQTNAVVTSLQVPVDERYLNDTRPAN
jgi:AhpD family alkylhydroperoxidase